VLPQFVKQDTRLLKMDNVSNAILTSSLIQPTPLYVPYQLVRMKRLKSLRKEFAKNVLTVHYHLRIDTHASLFNVQKEID
jgi:hypothetical protein